MQGTSWIALTRSGSLILSISDSTAPLVLPWVPFECARVDSREPGAALIAIGSDAIDSDALTPERDEAATGVPTLRLGGVLASAVHSDVVQLSCVAGNNAARLDLSALRSIIWLSDMSSASASHDTFSMLTLSAAFLLGRTGGVLMHAGAIVDPAGRAWLFVGDSHSGKTTTIVSLISAGWSYLSDDQVVLTQTRDGGVIVEGWPRVAHLDEGWSRDSITGHRVNVDLREQWLHRWQRAAPLGGVLMPFVEAEQTTDLRPAHPASIFAALVRQSPWLMADPAAAHLIMPILEYSANRPGFSLRLGKDSYARGALLAEQLAVLHA